MMHFLVQPVHNYADKRSKSIHDDIVSGDCKKSELRNTDRLQGQNPDVCIMPCTKKGKDF